ncbi:MAG TPA: tRNA (adenosine(37)-N6)-threonylcarbamoyltransferase complex dimerization subunit type 1 TsaB [Candidatus Saccharimonadales bacterium]|nr:tRNA (adenosine(37)-N6)-threonylcarbamoyltransferase complex dimerization subunit type 1 TsaB [Candidatus Saccharimonadales bacterium]
MILILKTAGMECEIGLLDETGQKITGEIWQSGRELSEGLLTHILEIIKQNQASIDDLSGIIVFEGPGSFTSLRIGLSVANTMAYSQNLPIVGSTGKNWITAGFTKLKSAKPGDYVMPAYGAEANITKPRK